MLGVNATLSTMKRAEDGREQMLMMQQQEMLQKELPTLGHIASQKLMENAKKDVKDSHTLICSAL